MEILPTIMVIEDEELLLEAITRKLESRHLTVLACKNGTDALALLRSQTILPSAIWLDYYLTDMSGLEFMQEIKKNDTFATIPVVVVSNSANPEKVSSMLALGAKKYILKAEYRLDDIIETILSFTKKDSQTLE